MTFAISRHVPWVLNTSELRLLPGSAANALLMSGHCKSFYPTGGGTNNTPVNPLAGFEGPLRGGEREEKRRGKEGTEGSRGHPKIDFW